LGDKQHIAKKEEGKRVGISLKRGGRERNVHVCKDKRFRELGIVVRKEDMRGERGRNLQKSKNGKSAPHNQIEAGIRICRLKRRRTKSGQFQRFCAGG